MLWLARCVTWDYHRAEEAGRLEPKTWWREEHVASGIKYERTTAAPTTTAMFTWRKEHQAFDHEADKDLEGVRGDEQGQESTDWADSVHASEGV
mmetsp:Transcript_75048/g.200234  ORF Transcript_75048/g.200234 Transcript_75048/m.200234 type:complete len:94 (-) Transcript_75048:170-451(-)